MAASMTALEAIVGSIGMPFWRFHSGSMGDAHVFAALLDL